MADDRLDSWKEIAAYLKRSVRTARRWEHDEGLPVHRHVHQSLGTVYASKMELDAWKLRVRRSPIASAKTIAVLPFKDLSAEHDSEYLADGLTEEVTIRLSNMRLLRVTAGTSARIARGKNASAISALLGARYLLEGSIRRAGNRLRVTSQLTDAAANEHVWADTFDGTLEDVLAIQERIAREIVDALKLRLTSAESDRLGERSIEDPTAYDCYLRARHELWRWRKESIDHAVQLLHDGIAIVGDNARLYATLGQAYLQYRETGIDFSDEPLRKAEECARRILHSNSGFLLRGWIDYARGRIEQAVTHLEAALEHEPGNADALLLLSNCYLISGNVAKARPLIARALEIDPLTPLTRCMPAYADILEGNGAAAIEPYRQMFEMDRSNPMARLFYAWVLALNGRNGELKPLVDGFAPEARGTIAARIGAFLAHAVAGDERRAREALLPEIEAVATATDLFPRFLADGFASLGDSDAALHWLNVAVDRGFTNGAYLSRHDPFLEKLREDTRFVELMRRTG